MSAVVEPIAAAPPTDPQVKDRRHHGFWAEAQRNANTVFLFFMNPFLDADTNRLSGTKSMAWIMVWVDVYDVVHSHAIQELVLNKGTVDSLDQHNIELFGLAFLVWFGKAGIQAAIDLVKAWKGRESAS
jgi:hypothetical protein